MNWGIGSRNIQTVGYVLPGEKRVADSFKIQDRLSLTFFLGLKFDPSLRSLHKVTKVSSCWYVRIFAG